MELIERAHPLGVTLGQIVVDRHHVHSLACEGVQEHGQRRHQGLTLAGGHLRDVVRHLVAVHHAVEHHAADQLHVVVHHVPFHQVAAGHPLVAVYGLVALDGDEVLALGRQFAVGIGGCHLDGLVLGETACSLLDHGEYFGQRLVQVLGVVGEHVLAGLVYLLPQRLALLVIQSLDLGAQFVDVVLV